MSHYSFHSECEPFRPCMRQRNCWDAAVPNSTTACSWWIITLLTTVGLGLLLAAELLPRHEQRCITAYHKVRNGIRRVREWRRERNARMALQKQPLTTRRRHGMTTSILVNTTCGGNTTTADDNASTDVDDYSMYGMGGSGANNNGNNKDSTHGGGGNSSTAMNNNESERLHKKDSVSTLSASTTTSFTTGSGGVGAEGNGNHNKNSSSSSSDEEGSVLMTVRRKSSMAGGSSTASTSKTMKSLPYDLERAFVTTVRTEENFVRNNADPAMVLPAPYSSEYTPRFSPNVIYPVTGFGLTNDQFSTTLLCIFIGSLGWAFVCSAISSILYQAINYESMCSNNKDEAAIAKWVSGVGKAFSTILSGYQFFPVFLIAGYTGFVVTRWRDWMVNCHCIQGQLHNVALHAGAAAAASSSSSSSSSSSFPNTHTTTDPTAISSTTVVTPAVRKRLYKIYRYLNLIHALCYKNVSPSLHSTTIEDDFVRMGLVTTEEAYALLAVDNKARDNALTWLMGELNLLMTMEGGKPDYVGRELSANVSQLRALCAKHHDMFVRDNPNLYLNLMLIVVNLMVFLVIVGSPFSLFVPTPDFIISFQPMVALGVFVQTVALRSAYGLLLRLRNPFSWTVDQIKVDNLLASSDRAMFIHLRALFDSHEPPPPKSSSSSSRRHRNKLTRNGGGARREGMDFLAEDCVLAAAAANSSIHSSTTTTTEDEKERNLRTIKLAIHKRQSQSIRHLPTSLPCGDVVLGAVVPTSPTGRAAVPPGAGKLKFRNLVSLVQAHKEDLLADRNHPLLGGGNGGGGREVLLSLESARDL